MTVRWPLGADPICSRVPSVQFSVYRNSYPGFGGDLTFRPSRALVSSSKLGEDTGDAVTRLASRPSGQMIEVSIMAVVGYDCLGHRERMFSRIL
jgi:hypothetical protein